MPIFFWTGVGGNCWLKVTLLTTGAITIQLITCVATTVTREQKCFLGEDGFRLLVVQKKIMSEREIFQQLEAWILNLMSSIGIKE